MVYDKSFDSVYFDILDCETARVVYNYSDDVNYKINKTCVALGCYVTCFFHLKLLKCLNKLPANSVLYYDTDSIIYYSESGYGLLQTDSKLGYLESELDEDEHIISFVSTGPKSYTYHTNLGKEIIHVKGFKKKKKEISSDYLYDLIENIHNVYEIKEFRIDIDKSLYIKNIEGMKRFSFTFDKRQIERESFNTVPWGYLYRFYCSFLEKTWCF